MFPGQGAQYVGMGACLHKGSAAARRVFEEVDESLGRFLSREMFSGTAASLSRTSTTQPALLAHSIAVLRCLEETRGEAMLPSLVMGHSVGEFAALVSTGSLGLSEAARLLRIRGEAMQAAADASQASCTMQALLFSPSRENGEGGGVERALQAVLECARTACEESTLAGKGTVTIAALNSPTQVVLSGHALAVEHAVALLQGRGGAGGDPVHPRLRRAIALPVSAPFHSPIMLPAAETLREALSGCSLLPSSTPLLAGLHARPVSSRADLEAALVGGVASPVVWGECVHRALRECGGEKGVHFLELGGVEGGTLCALVRQGLKEGVLTNSLSTMASIKNFTLPQ